MLQVTTPERQEQRQRDIKLARDPEEENQVLDVLENTLWNRQLGVMSEEIVAALVCQIFEGEVSAQLRRCSRSAFFQHQHKLVSISFQTVFPCARHVSIGQQYPPALKPREIVQGLQLLAWQIMYMLDFAM